MYTLQNVCIGGPILEVFRNFLFGRHQSVEVDCARRSVVDLVSGVPQGSVLGPLFFLLYIADLPSLLENTLISYADDSTLVASVSSPRERFVVAVCINRDVVLINARCNRWGMLIYPSMIYDLIVSRSRTGLPAFLEFSVNGCQVRMVGQLSIFSLILDSKLTFESHVARLVVAFASCRIVFFFEEGSRCYWSFILLVLEYCSPDWMSAISNLKNL